MYLTGSLTMNDQYILRAIKLDVLFSQKKRKKKKNANPEQWIINKKTIKKLKNTNKWNTSTPSLIKIYLP